MEVLPKSGWVGVLIFVTHWLFFTGRTPWRDFGIHRSRKSYFSLELFSLTGLEHESSGAPGRTIFYGIQPVAHRVPGPVQRAGHIPAYFLTRALPELGKHSTAEPHPQPK